MNRFIISLTSVGFVLFQATTVTLIYAQQETALDGLQINVAKNVNVSIQSEPLNHLVNTTYNELDPRPTKDGKRLYFSREGYPGNMGGVDDEDIWYSEFDEATQLWSEAINMGPPLNNSAPNFITGVGSNGDTLLVANAYRKKGKMIAGVCVTVKEGDLWSYPIPVNIEADYNIARRATYDVSHDRKTMVIAQQKFDTRGNLDLYVSFRNPGSNKNPYAATESINLGKVINTAADETSPWLAYDGITLYFSSDGHNGFGRMDIFKSIRLDDTWTNWSEPTNLGPGINSSLDDVSFNFNPLSRYAYFARGMSSRNSNIFRIDMTHLFFSKEAVYPMGLPPREKPAEIGETKVVWNVFQGDETVINKAALVDLQAIFLYLQKHQTMNVLVSAHSKKHSTRDASLKLSNERASKVVEYLVQNGIQRDRLTQNGLGDNIVINQKTTDSIQTLSSSVEFKIIKYDD